MHHEYIGRQLDGAGYVDRPPLRRFVVQQIDPDNPGWRCDHTIEAHLVFNNTNRGEGLVFRRYYDDNVRTEKVAEFQPGHFSFYKEIA